jgi:probable rRNA maturation factor
MRRINREHRAIDRPTDVLAFAMNEGMPMKSMVHALGDIVIAWPTARRQALEHGWSVEREICLLVAHGLLHLLGFDHATKPTERRMMARTHLLMATALSRRSQVEKPESRALSRPARSQKPRRV